MACIRTLGLIAAVALATCADTEPKILSNIAGLYGCIGVKDIETAASYGCFVEEITDCSGKTTKKANTAIVPGQALKRACHGQSLKNDTSQDGMPVTFSWPVDMDSVKAEHFVWNFPDGTSRPVECAMPGGRPADEPNELQTIALVGNAGGWTPNNRANAIEIVGDLMLVAPNGSKVSAKGLKYSGSALEYSVGPILLTADLEAFSTKGETLENPLFPPVHCYPNHCRADFPDTTHRIRLLFNGGVSLDSIKQITPDRVDLIEVLDGSGSKLDSTTYLGLADLGAAPMPKTQCEKDTYETDGDNYVDVCLKLTTDGPIPTKVHLPCTPGKQIAVPKGPKYPCAAQTVVVRTSSDEPNETSRSPSVDSDCAMKCYTGGAVGGAKLAFVSVVVAAVAATVLAV